MLKHFVCMSFYLFSVIFHLHKTAESVKSQSTTNLLNVMKLHPL